MVHDRGSDVMLKDIIRQYSIIHVAGREYRVRFSLNALLCLEMTYKPLSELLKVPFADWSIEDVLQLTHAAVCSLPANSKAVSYRDFDYVEPTLAELGELIGAADLPLLRLELADAVLSSLPAPTEEPDKEPTKAMHEGHQRAMYVDVIGRPESEYWNSTNREITQRIDCYLEVKGEKEAPTLVRRYGEMRQGEESI